MKNLIIISHQDKKSFCYNGIYKTILKTLKKNKEDIKVLDLYRDDYSQSRKKLIKGYQESVTWSDRIYFISPVWWFRLTPRLEIFFDEVMTPGFAYKIVQIKTKKEKPLPETVIHLRIDTAINLFVSHSGKDPNFLYLGEMEWKELKQFVYPYVCDENNARYKGVKIYQTKETNHLVVC